MLAADAAVALFPVGRQLAHPKVVRATGAAASAAAGGSACAVLAGPYPGAPAQLLQVSCLLAAPFPAPHHLSGGRGEVAGIVLYVGVHWRKEGAQKKLLIRCRGIVNSSPVLGFLYGVCNNFLPSLIFTIS